MFEEVETPARGGALHLGRVLPAEETEQLDPLPCPRPDRDEAIAAQLAAAAVFVPQGGGRWPRDARPSALEAAAPPGDGAGVSR